MASLLLAGAGCHYNVALHSPVVGARVEGDQIEPRLLPTELRVPWTPWKRREVTVVAPGYRALTLDLGWRTITTSDAGLHRMLLGGGRHAEIEVLLVPEHGGVGTWDLGSEGP